MNDISNPKHPGKTLMDILGERAEARQAHESAEAELTGKAFQLQPDDPIRAMLLEMARGLIK